MKSQSHLPLFLFAAIAFAIPTIATAATLQVSNTGTDGPTCGGVTPCRSISAAIANAASGDTVLVGPGFYSTDLDRDGVQGEPGDEPTFMTISKAVKVTSTFGASSTVLQGVTVDIEASNVVFGKLNGGFTIATNNNPILVLGGVPPSTANVRVAGNVIVEDDPGGGGAAFIVFQAGGRFENNRVVTQHGCGVGFFLLNDTATATVSGNSVVGCTTGFEAQDSPGIHLVNNTAVGNAFAPIDGIGFDLHGAIAEFSGNVAIGNGTGARVVSAIPIFQHNAFVGSATHCGVTNGGGTTLNAANNWWGSPAGPSPTFDAACNTNGSTTITAPFLTTDPSNPQSALR